MGLVRTNGNMQKAKFVLHYQSLVLLTNIFCFCQLLSSLHSFKHISRCWECTTLLHLPFMSISQSDLISFQPSHLVFVASRVLFVRSKYHFSFLSRRIVQIGLKAFHAQGDKQVSKWERKRTCSIEHLPGRLPDEFQQAIRTKGLTDGLIGGEIQSK